MRDADDRRARTRATIARAPSPAAMRPQRRWWGRALLTVAMCVVAPVAMIALLDLSGLLSLGWHASSVSPAGRRDFPALGAMHGRTAHARRRAADVLRRICASDPVSASDVRTVAAALAGAGAYGVPPDAERSMVIFRIPERFADWMPAGAAMTVIGGIGLLTWNPYYRPGGSGVYHELIHFGQFRRSEGAQRRLVDSLHAADEERPFTASEVWDAWSSVVTPLTYGHAAQREALDSALAGVLVRAALDTGYDATPAEQVARAAERVLSEPAFAALRERLAHLAWLRQRLTNGPVEAPWGWREELRRLLYFEAAAYAAEDACARGAAAPRAPLP